MAYPVNSKPLTIVFVDYESWFWGLYNIFGETPDVESLIKDVKQQGNLEQVYFFGDFTKEQMQKERFKLRNFTNDIIDCANPSDNKKDYTDFIMLDHIYKTILLRQDVEQYILVTGDGHFSSVVAYLKTFKDKIVGIYGVKGSISPQLEGSASWCKTIEPRNAKYEYQKVLSTIQWAEAKKIELITFGKTVEICSRFYKAESAKISASLSKLIDDGYIDQVVRKLDNGQEIRVLVTNWNLLIKHGIWSSSDSSNPISAR
jgi:hypothetical protein